MTPIFFFKLIKGALRPILDYALGFYGVQSARISHGINVNRVRKQSRQRPINVIFIVEMLSAWKAESVFRIMQASPIFFPIILVVKLEGREAVAAVELERSISYMKNQGYPYNVLGRQDSSGGITTLESLKPDLVFFSNPHKIVPDEVYQIAFRRWLSCYIPYSHQVSKYDDYRAQYNQEFHNKMWKIFAPHAYEIKIFEEHSYAKGRNVVLSGYPPCKVLAENRVQGPFTRKDSSQLHIIWAPHHTIAYSDLPYSNFLRIAEQMRALVKKYSHVIKWSFKPHPLLKQSLSVHPEWKETVNDYYDWWRSQENTAIVEGDYKELFIISDAMIHDSGSFLAEYLYLNKPVMYIWSSANLPDYFNEFGCKALQVCERGDSVDDIENFIARLIRGVDLQHKPREEFWKRELEHLVHDSPAEKIVLDLQKSLNLQ